MSEKRKILIQLDTDPRPSVFDRVVAVDAGAGEVFSYGGVTPEIVREIIYGAIFTRGPEDLHRTACFVGGGNLALGEKVLEKASRSFLGNLRVSLMLDCAGANTTAAAAVLALGDHLDLGGAPVLVLGGTGAVGLRVARLLTHCGAAPRLGSRKLERASEAAAFIRERTGGETTPVQTASADDLARALDGVQAVVAAGGAGVTLLPRTAREAAGVLRVAVDLNAVPPAGIEGIEVQDRGAERDGIIGYGAIGVGGTKMKIHRAALEALFERNDQILDAEEILEIGRRLS